MNPAETERRFILLEVVPHVRSGQGRRIPHPDLDRIYDEAWWTKAIWGHTGARDPHPAVTRLGVLTQDEAEVILERELPAVAPENLGEPVPRDAFKDLTPAQKRVVECLKEQGNLVMNPEGRWLSNDQKTRFSPQTIRTMERDGLIEIFDYMGGPACRFTQDGIELAFADGE